MTHPQKRFVIGLSALLLMAIIIWLKFSLFKPSPTISTPEEKETTSATEPTLPPNFPTDFPQIPSAVLVAAQSVRGEQEGLSAVWETSEKITAVIAFYQQELNASGWNYQITSQNSDFAAFRITKGDTQGILGITQGQDNKVVVTVALGLSFASNNTQ